MTLHTWIRWAFRPTDSRHRAGSISLAKQAGRDLGREVTHAEFCGAMRQAGFRVACVLRGNQFFACTDTSQKKNYQWRKFVCLVDVPHPLLEPAPT